jgi:hypothetical protein
MRTEQTGSLPATAGRMPKKRRHSSRAPHYPGCSCSATSYGALLGRIHYAALCPVWSQRRTISDILSMSQAPICIRLRADVLRVGYWEI